MAWLRKWRRKFFPKRHFELDYFADACGVRGKNLGFMADPAFDATWQRIDAHNKAVLPRGIPDVRWRIHVAVWAARHALRLEGDFVEFGVNTGILATAICELTDFAKQKRNFYLFDTFHGIPASAADPEEAGKVAHFNEAAYPDDVYEITKAHFAAYPNVKLVRGILPDTLAEVTIEKIAFVSMDLNVAKAEMETIERVWDRMVPGAIAVLDDYGWGGHEPQYVAWNAFAASKGLSICTLPTGQGLLIKV